MSFGVTKDYKLKQKNISASHTRERSFFFSLNEFGNPAK